MTLVVPRWSPPREVVRRWGEFQGPVRTEWLRERGGDRRMLLTQDVAFARASGDVVTARAGLVLDGASIPRALWALVGSPFTGDYRDGAVIHDWLCQRRAASGYDSPTAHHILYECAMALQCHPLRARAVHRAVAMFGPHWRL